MSDIKLHWHNHKYFPYEKELGIRELKTLLSVTDIICNDKSVTIKSSAITEKKLDRLVYFSDYIKDGCTVETLQRRLEKSCSITGNHKKQSTRYSVHGIHEYKGKFNPQIVRGILNILNIKEGSKLLDPFCGSGTTLVESTHSNMEGYGTDMNPLAIYISNSKLLALNTKASILLEHFRNIFATFDTTVISNHEDEYTEYLRDWFPEDNYNIIERLRVSILKEGGEYKSIFFVLASDILRDYSLQEPADLRIRRRKSPFPDISFMEAFKIKFDNFLANLLASQNIVGLMNQKGLATLWDSRESMLKVDTLDGSKFDVAITSPPYATALPYIDTQRLSLIWLRFLDKKEVKNLEASLTGSRELLTKARKELQHNFLNNTSNLTKSVYKYCLELNESLSEDDGFRRQAVPYLMYRYFSDMQAMFISVKNSLKLNAPFALVVGHNHTTLGGKRFDVDTPELLKEVALSVGWKHQESFPLQAYHRYDLHSKNAVKHETLLILRKND